MLPWMDIAISNAMRLSLNNHHDIEPQYLQSYLNETFKITPLKL